MRVVVVVGQGPAGMLAADWARQLGADVVLVAGAEGSLPLWSGTWDFRSRSRAGGLVMDPFGWLTAGEAWSTDIGWDASRWALWWRAVIRSGRASGIHWPSAPPTANRWTMTAAGRLRPAFLIPPWQWATETPGSVTWVGFEGLADAPLGLIHARYQALPGSTSRQITLPAPAAWRPHWSSLSWAAFFDRSEGTDWLRETTHQAFGAVRAESAVVFPQVLGIQTTERLLAALGQQLGVPVYEYPLMPPSVGGIRIRDRWRYRLKATGVQWRQGWVDAVSSQGVQLADGSGWIEADHVIVATGGLAGGGLLLTATGRLVNTATGSAVPWSGAVDDLARVGIGTEGHQYSAVGRVIGGFDPDLDGDGGAMTLWSVANALQGIFGTDTVEAWLAAQEG